MEYIGFAMALIGLGGLAECGGLNRGCFISLILTAAGGILMYMGEKNEKSHHIDRADRNVLDRLFFL